MQAVSVIGELFVPLIFYSLFVDFFYLNFHRNKLQKKLS